MNENRVSLLLRLDAATRDLKDGVLETVVKFAEAALTKQRGKTKARSKQLATANPFIEDWRIGK